MSFAGLDRLKIGNNEPPDKPLSNWWIGLITSTVVAFMGMVVYLMVLNPAPISQNLDVNTSNEVNTAIQFHNQRVIHGLLFRR